ncbi:MAG: acyl-CoA dehydrogenase family protein [Acidimicrobiales bacterium]
MKLELSDEALEYGQASLRAIESAGGDRLVQIAEEEPERWEGLVAPVLKELGADELDPGADADELEAAAALCRSAGYWVVPYPLAGRLCRPRELDAAGLVVVADPPRACVPTGGSEGWVAVGLEGRRSWARALQPSEPVRRSAFVVELELRPIDEAGAASVPLGLVLPCWTLLGMLDRALALTRAYVLERSQFGQPLASFQSVQFQLTEAEVERSGLEELAKFTLWSIGANPSEALADALALRLAAIEAAEIVFRVAHQLHGATGFCDETVLSWLSRYSQPLRRLPLGLSATREQLTRHVGRQGLSGIFALEEVPYPFSETRT